MTNLIEGHKALHSGDLKNADKIYSEYFQINPLEFECLANWAQVAHKLNQNNRAIILGMMALTLVPKHKELFEWVEKLIKTQYNYKLEIDSISNENQSPLELYRQGYVAEAHAKAKNIVKKKKESDEEIRGIYLWLCSEVNDFFSVIHQVGELTDENFPWGNLARSNVALKQGDTSYAKEIINLVPHEGKWQHEKKLMLARLYIGDNFEEGLQELVSKSVPLAVEINKKFNIKIKEEKNCPEILRIIAKKHEPTLSIFTLLSILHKGENNLDILMDICERWGDIGENLYAHEYSKAIAKNYTEYPRPMQTALNMALRLPHQIAVEKINEVLDDLPKNQLRMYALTHVLIKAAGIINRPRLVEEVALYGLINNIRDKFCWEFLSISLSQQNMNSRAIGILGNALTIINDEDDKSDLYARIALLSINIKDNLAIQNYAKRSLNINPNNKNALTALIEMAWNLKTLKKGLDLTEQLFNIDKKNITTHTTLARFLAHQSRWPRVKSLLDYTKNATKNFYIRGLWESRLFMLSYHPDLDAQEIANEFFEWGSIEEINVKHSIKPKIKSLNNKFRVGFLSPDIRAHTSRYYFYPLFSNSPSDIVTVALSDAQVEEEVTTEFKKIFSEWHSVAKYSDEELVNFIDKLDLDCIIDGCNHMANSRIHLYARKLAPVQITWLGSAWTSGLKSMDYVMMDPICAPAGSETLFSEKIIRLPYSLFCYERNEMPNITPLPAIQNGYITFGNFGRLERFNRHTFRAWKKILDKVPNSKFIFDFKPFADEATRNYFKDLLADNNLPTDRILIRYSADVLPAFSDIDITLDAFPHAGGTVLFDSIGMGVPIVTLAARPPVGRFGANIMHNIGLSDWVANSEEDYVDKAVYFANNLDYLSATRSTIRHKLLNSKLCDGKSFSNYFFLAVKNAILKSRNGQPPKNFEVLPDGMIQD